MEPAFQVSGRNETALFTLQVYRGEGMALLAMNWRRGTPPADFAGFAIEYKEPGHDRFFALKNRLSFAGKDGRVHPNSLSTKLSPIQKFRWVHFPRNAELPGEFTYRVTPVFMNEADELSYGDAQEAAIELRRETLPGRLNVTFTRGFVSSQAFVDRYADHSMATLLPRSAAQSLAFKPTHPEAQEALRWMGFEARSAILEVLDEAVKDRSAEVSVIAYDLNEPDLVARFEQLGSRLRIIIDDDGAHKGPKSPESIAAKRLALSAGKDHVKRQHLGKLQHNKVIVVDGAQFQAAVCGSTNFSWRGFFVQNNNAVIVRGPQPVRVFLTAFQHYWAHDDAAGFGETSSATWNDLGLAGLDARLGFSPRSARNAVLDSIAADISGATTSSLFFSLAFLFQTKGAIRDAIVKVRKARQVFSYGISDHQVPGLEETSGIDLQKPDGTVTVVRPEALAANVPQPFKAEPTGGGGTRMHHKFVVIDFDKPTARVYLGSFNFSRAADTSNGENLLLIRDRRVAVSYVVEALRIFDHHHFRVAQVEAQQARKSLQLARPPRRRGEQAWWTPHYLEPRKIRDRELFASM